jgi:hypothetical protein
MPIAPKVFEFTDQNPPPASLLAKYDIVIWRSPHGTLQVDRRGNFMPISEDAARRMLGAPAPGASPSPSPSPGTALPTLMEASKAKMSTGVRAAGEEMQRARTESALQGTLARGKFAAPEAADPFEGLGIAERAQAEQLVKQGMSPEEAAARVKKVPPAAAQAGALQP